jgi:hypothetical protein
LPITDLGQKREALMGNAELYKKKLIEYLEISRGLTPKMDSFIEGTLADCILSDKNGQEYWVEAKATSISLNEAKFVCELAEYIAEYLIRRPDNRFKMILAIEGYKNKDFFLKVYKELDEVAIKEFLDFLMQVADEKSKKVITRVAFKEIKHFFEDSEVIRAVSIKIFQDAIDKRRPRPPVNPKLPDAEYAVGVLERYKSNEPLIEEDWLFCNLFELKMPNAIYVADTVYDSEQEFLANNPEFMPPPIRIIGGKAFSFFDLSTKGPIGIALKSKASRKEILKQWDVATENHNIILYLLYQWIDDLCFGKGLSFDRRTERFYFADEKARKYPFTIHWKSEKTNVRDVITPVKREDGTIYYYSHRAVNLAARYLWSQYFVQLRPGRVFTGDCYTPYPGSISDKLDRAYRKSKFNRNQNQLNDVLFWADFLFEAKGASIEDFFATQRGYQNVVKTLSQISVISNVKPNEAETDEDPDNETLTASELLSSFLEEEDDEE